MGSWSVDADTNRTTGMPEGSGTRLLESPGSFIPVPSAGRPGGTKSGGSGPGNSGDRGIGLLPIRRGWFGLLRGRRVGGEGSSQKGPLNRVMGRTDSPAGKLRVTLPPQLDA